jgi:hypothetical protein
VYLCFALLSHNAHITLHSSIAIPRNFRWIAKTKSKNKWGKKLVADAIPRTSPMDADVTKVNNYVTSMLAVSLGIKLADAGRRVCMYTKATDLDKGFYALCRGIFPIHELCGTVTALALARRDVLGQRMPFWKMLLPAAIIHGMANFRGMKVRYIHGPIDNAMAPYLAYAWPSTNLILLYIYLFVLLSHSPFSNGILPHLGPKCNCRPLSWEMISPWHSSPARPFPRSCG